MAALSERTIRSYAVSDKMKYSIFNYFYGKKYSTFILILNLKEICGLFDFYDRLSFIFFIHIFLDLLIFAYRYLYIRSGILYSRIKEKLDFSKKKEPVFDIMYNKEKFCIGKKTIISDRPRCRFSTRNRKDINHIYTVNSTIVTKSLYL